MSNHTEPIKKSSPLSVALAWILVAVPLGYGLQATFVKAMQLFTG